MRTIQYISSLVFLLVGGSSLGQDATVNWLSREDFSNILMSTIFRLMPYSADGKGTEFGQVLSKAKWTECGFEILDSFRARAYGNENKPKPIDFVRRTMRSVDTSETERKLSKNCQSIARGHVRAITDAVLAALVNPSKLRGAIEHAKKELQDILDSDQATTKAILEVLGIVPGVSRKEDFMAIAHTREGYCDPHCLTVGGYDLQCEAEYDDHGMISTLTCWFGGRQNGTNIEMFAVLESGFTEKFGKPRVRLTYAMQTVLGARFDVANPKWRDEKGNTLEMASRVDTIHSGAFALKSAAQNAKELGEKRQREGVRKF